jgi:WhiB family redox-sensing transcriptional regulator
VNWTDEARCVGKTYLFFGPEDERPRDRLVREAQAKSLCETCPVKSECLETAIARDERGIWGGKTERERKRMTRRLSVPPHIKRALPAPEPVGPSWRVLEVRANLSGAPVRLMIAETGVSWHGFQWAVYRGDVLAFLADNEPDAWLYFHSLVMA